MKNRLRIGLMTAIIIVLTIHFGTLLSDPPSAQAVWVKGTVTKAPWLDRHYRIGINGITYTFMPEIGITFPDKSLPKVSSGKLSSLLKNIGTEQPVLIKAQGHIIHEIIIN